MFVFQNISNSESFNKRGSLAVILITAMPAFLIWLVGTFDADPEPNRTLSYALLNLIIAVLSHFLCIYYSGLNFAVRKWYWRIQSKETKTRFMRKAGLYSHVFIGAACAVMLLLMIPDYPDFDMRRTRNEERIEEISIFFDTLFDEYEENIELTDEELYELFLMEIYDLDEEEGVGGFRRERSNAVHPAALIAVIVIITAAVFYILLTNNKKEKDDKEDEDNSEVFEEDECIESVKTRGKIKASLGANQLVRIMFIRKVNTHRKRSLHVKKADTANSIADKIGNAPYGGENITELNNLYHIARYSGKAVTKSEIASIKKGKENQ
jgi:hypothetical protein